MHRSDADGHTGADDCDGATDEDIPPTAVWKGDVLDADVAEVCTLGCEVEITGSVDLRESDRTDLRELSCVVAIDQSLLLRNADHLTSLAGLESPRTLGGGLSVAECDALASLTGLVGLPTIPGTVDIHGDAALASLAGLEGVTSIGGALTLEDLPQLTTVAGLAGREIVRDRFEIVSNRRLADPGASARLGSSLLRVRSSVVVRAGALWRPVSPATVAGRKHGRQLERRG